MSSIRAGLNHPIQFPFQTGSISVCIQPLLLSEPFLRHRKYKLQRPTVVQCKQSIQTYPLTQTKTTFAFHHEYSFPLRERPNNCRAAQIKSLLSVCFVIGMREREREHLYRIINIAHMHFHKVSNKNCGPLSICLRSLDISIK